MNRKLKIKVIKYRKDYFYIVVALNKKSIRSHYIDKLGVCFFRNGRKIIMCDLIKLSFWLNKGAQISYIAKYMFAIIFAAYVIKKREEKDENLVNNPVVRTTFIYKKRNVKNFNFNNYLKKHVIFTKKKK